MSARTAGRVLLALVASGAVGVVVLGLVTGAFDPILLAVAAVLLALATGLVVRDEREDRAAR